MPNIELVPITRELFRDLYGEYPQHTLRGYALKCDDKTASVGGVYYMKDQVVAFFNIDPDYQHLELPLAKGVLKVMKMIKELNRPVLAVADKNIPGSENFLMKCGFRYLNKGPNGEVFVWQQH